MAEALEFMEDLELERLSAREFLVFRQLALMAHLTLPEFD